MKQSFIEELNDKNWIINNLNNGVGTIGMSKMLGCHYTAVTRAIKRLGLQHLNKRTKYPMLNDKEWLSKELKTKSFRFIAKELGTSAGNVADHAYRLGIAKRQKNKSDSIKASFKKMYPDGRFGEQASNWRGGKRKLNGYIAITSPEHPDKTSGGYVFEHRLIAEKKIGRRLNRNEVVHHVNGDKLDNRPENLEVVKRSFHVSNHYTDGEGIQKLTNRIKLLEQRLLDNNLPID